MRIVLVGAVGSTRVALQALAEWPEGLTALATLPTSRAARHSDYEDLRGLAAQHGVAVIDVINVNAPESLEALRSLEPDLVMVIGWSQLCGPEFLRLPRLGTVGFHPAPLPEFRGRAVIPWTILERRAVTGASLFWMDEGMDSGDLLAQELFDVAPDETAETLYRKHEASLARMLGAVSPAVLAGTPPRLPQDHSRATYCARRTAQDGEIDWHQPAEQVWTLIRAVTRPYPGAFTQVRGGKCVVWAADLIDDAPFIGLPGQIQTIIDGAPLVRCGDGRHLLLKETELTAVDGAAPPAFERHAVLGQRGLR